MAALKDRLVDAAYGLGWSLVYRVPESWPRWVFCGPPTWRGAARARGCRSWRTTCAG